MAGASIEWRDVRKAFSGKRVLDGFSLSVAAGESVAILGASGSGKSVALRHVIGLVQPDGGDVVVDGQGVAARAEEDLHAVRRRIGMVFQGGALFDSMSVAENVAYGLSEHFPGMSPRDVSARVEECLSLVRLPGTGSLAPSSLSGGMKKRVALARALAVRPEAVLYDEPTTGLDPVTTSHVNQLIRDMQRRLRVTSVVVTHDVASALFVADRVCFLRDGRVAFDGTVEEAESRPSPELRAFMRGEGAEA